MPKMKTKTAAKKRFKVSANGKISHRHAGRSHNMEHKTRKLKRSMRRDHPIHDSDMKEARKLLGTYVNNKK